MQVEGWRRDGVENFLFVQNELATHNLTPELARAFLRASTPDERILLNKPSMKSDVQVEF